MTYKYKNVYIDDSSIIGGKYESEGPLKQYFDRTYSDFYFGEQTFEQAEIKIMKDSIDKVLEKTNKTINDIDVFIAGDLSNQIVNSNYVARELKIPYLGVYNACSTSAEAIIIGANMIEAKQANNILTSVSAHNLMAEKQFRFPSEYGGNKLKYTTFTVTCGASLILTNQKSKIKVESSTIGKVIDMGVTDVNNMGGVMAPGACDVILTHLKETNRNISYYDFVLTGDLGLYGKEILKELMKMNNVSLDKYNDAGVMLYDLKKQDVFAGGSGPSCGPAVLYGFIFDNMKKGKMKKVLYVPTGALMNTTMVNQKMTIPCISHAISLEVE